MTATAIITTIGVLAMYVAFTKFDIGVLMRSGRRAWRIQRLHRRSMREADRCIAALDSAASSCGRIISMLKRAQEGCRHD